jgi:hypothetical protein
MAKPPGFTPPSGKGANTVVGIRRLPKSGRKGPAPEWPLEEYRPGEMPIWVALWKLPQAVAWEEQSVERAVARYVRLLNSAETAPQPLMASALYAQVAAMEDRLGLTPKAMRLLLWVIEDDDVSAGQRVAATGTEGRRLKAVD